MNTRRKMLKTLALGSAAACLNSVEAQGAPAGATTRATGPAEKPLRFVHLTDMHVTAKRKGNEGFVAALKAASTLDPAPAFVVTGGDHVMDALGNPRALVETYWKLYRQALADGTKLQVYPVLGNHDIWGWGAPEKVAKTEAGYGKVMPLAQLGLERSYYAFDVGTWHFVVLDSMQQRGNDYFAQIDDVQRKWLEADLAAVRPGRNICVLSHIPILAACVFFDGERLKPDFWHVPDAWMHRDSAMLIELFRTHRVRLAISGHIHLQDRVEYDGITFICNGAVCGKWWEGPYHKTPAGFGVFDLYADGRFDYRYVDFGWTPKA